jgi:hypothetical protein
MSNRPGGRRGDAGQGCNSYLPQSKDEEPDDGEYYAAGAAVASFLKSMF